MKMSSTYRTLRTCGLIFYLFYHVNGTINPSQPRILSMKIISKLCDYYKCKYLLNVRGAEFLGHYPWRVSSTEGARGGNCDVMHPNHEISEVESAQFYTILEVIVPNVNDRIYFCIRDAVGKNAAFPGEWVHQGADVYLNPKNDILDVITETKLMHQPTQNSSLEQTNTEWSDLSHDIDVNYLPNAPRLTRQERNDVEIIMRDRDVTGNEARARPSKGAKKSRRRRQIESFTSIRAVPIPISIEGIRIENSDKEPSIVDEEIPSVLADTAVTLRIFGDGLTSRTVIAFTHEEKQYGQPCKFLLKGEYMVKEGSLKAKTALFVITAPAPTSASKLYICAKNLKPGLTDPLKDEDKYIHQGNETWKHFASHNSLLPLWFSLSLILVCLAFSALFSGLNLGLMSLDRTELKIISNTGTEQERKYARAIMPVRDHGNYLLCSILLGNVAVNSTFTILLDELTSGLFAVIFSTLSIVLLGEITPQAICSRHGLMIGAKSIMITKAVMALTAPMAFPVSKLLDYFLGEEIGSVYNRERLKELVKVTTDVNDLDKDEVNIISGALELRKKTVEDVMTKLEDVFMLPISSVLDFETMSEIIKSGYSRIPVYEGSRGNIVTVLFIKDLAFVDPDDNTPLRTLCQYYQNPCNFVFEDVTLDVMFRQFKEGHKGHMAFVHRINNEGEGDPFYETIGLVTLEDVIEEMIQAEIVDETDVFMDNRSKRRRNRPQNKLQDFAAFAERHENQRIHISPQLTLATFQFLSTSVDAFRPDTVSETVLRRLLKQDVIQYIKLKGKGKRDPSTYVFQQGKPVDYFVLILEGRVEVTVGRENLVFEAGPFTYFGVQALTQNIGVAESPTPSAMGSLQNINMDSMLRHTFVPDYSVRAITELYYLTVKRSLYLAAKRATLMEKGALSKGATNEQFDTEVDKISSRLNIIELMQIPQSYSSTERFDAKYDKCLTQQSHEKHWSTTNASVRLAAMERNTPRQSFYSSSSLTNDGVVSENLLSDVTASKNTSNDLDANSCVECVRNNFWTDGNAMHKNPIDAKVNDSEYSKKKKATFRNDSSLLSFHNISSTSHNIIDYKLIPNIDYKCTDNDHYPSSSRSYYHNIYCERNSNIDYKYRDIGSKSNRNDDIQYHNRKDFKSIIDNDVQDAKSNNTDVRSTHNALIDIGYIDNNSESNKDKNGPCKIDEKSLNKLYISNNVKIESNNNSIRNVDSNCGLVDNFMCNNRLEESQRDLTCNRKWNEEKEAVERIKLETEQKIFSQLSKILRILEKDQT